MRREWTVDAREGPEAVSQALLECQVMGERLGGGFIVMPVRQEFGADDGRFFATTAWLFVWDSFAPAVKAAVVEPAEVEPDDVDDLADDLGMHEPVAAEAE